MKPNYKCNLLFRLIVSLCVVAQINAKAEDQATQDWKAFRKEFPFHIQTIALSKPSQNGSQTLIVSEPPPDATLDGIKNAAPVTMAAATIMQHPIGVDGWVKDVVVTVPAKSGALSTEITSLSGYLFGTSYKAYALQVPTNGTPPDKLNLDVQIGAHELREWLAQKSKFRTLTDSAGIAPNQIYGAAKTAIYYSSEPGLILWWVPTGTKLSEHRAIIRQFTLDSDLLIGGLIKDKGVLVIARERATPLERVHPMRTETIILLANVDEKELKQSYERNYPLAGRFDDENDWAPILLSPELRHTEFGSLLNITDQLLKGWTMAGTIKYRNFPYPAPARYPFYNLGKPSEYRPLFHLLNEQIMAKSGEGFGSLVFNWNTVGAGYSVDYSEMAVYAMNRTGALPVTYIPEGAEEDESGTGTIVREAMETGYAYYATLDDPNLARVFQYTGLYQLFRAARAAGKWKSTDLVPSQPQPENELRKHFVGALKQLRDEPDKMASAIASRNLQPTAKDISTLARAVSQIVEKWKRDASKYSMDSITKGLQELEANDAVEELLFTVESYEEELAAQSSLKLSPLPDNTPQTQTLRRAIERCSELIAQDDDYWKRLEVAVRKAKGVDKADADEAAEELKQFRDDLKRIGLESIRKYAGRESGSSKSGSEKDLLAIRKSLKRCKLLHEQGIDALRNGGGISSLLESLVSPTTEKLVATFTD